jgi:hypothetical protein
VVTKNQRRHLVDGHLFLLTEYTSRLFTLIGSLALSLDVAYSDFMGFARIEAIMLNSSEKIHCMFCLLGRVEIMQRSSKNDVIKMFISDDLFVSFFSLHMVELG